MGALAHYIEREGVPTTSISLIREHTEQIRPPRALWVSFPLGRPLGPPLQPDFQLDVLRSALRLLARPAGPVLEDYPNDAPEGDQDHREAWSCPLPLPPLAQGASRADQLREALALEVSLLRPWYEEGLRRRGRTAFGLSGLTPASVDDIAAFLAGFAAGEDPPLPPQTTAAMPAALRFMADDIKTFYLEAAASQPAASAPSAYEINRWLFGRTRLADALYAIRDRLAGSEDRRLRLVPLVPVLFRERPE